MSNAKKTGSPSRKTYEELVALAESLGVAASLSKNN
jgi:hypothetical protein